MNFRSPLFKYHAAGAVLLCAVLSLFISCENFLKAEEVSKEVKNFIEYSNSSSYTIKVNSKNGTGFVQSPAGGEATKKVSDVFNVTFNTDDDYEFIEWKIIDSVSKTQFNNGEYLEIDNLSQESATCTFVKAPAAGMQLSLVPVVAERPRIIDKTPAPGETNAYRDARIQIMFDHDMAEESLYYTGDEITDLIKEYDLDEENDFLQSADNPENIYGYKYGGFEYYKVISVINYNSKKSILNLYGEPVFETPDTLVIPMRNTYPDTGTPVYVTLKKDVAYMQSKLVTQKDDTPWMYYVGNKTDSTPPAIESNSTIKAWTKQISVYSDPSQDIEIEKEITQNIKIYDRTLFFDITVSDIDSGAGNYFDMEITKTSSGATPIPLRIYYNQVVNSKANRYYGKYKLPETVESGTYKITKLTVYDKKGKSQETIPTNFQDTYYNKTFVIDTSTSSFNPSVDNTDCADLIIKPNVQTSYGYRKFIIKYRDKDSFPKTKWDNIQGQEFFATSYSITGLDYAKTYEFEITAINVLGNIRKVYTDVSTPAYPMESVTYTVQHNSDTNKDLVYVNYKKPTQGKFKGVYIALVDPQNGAVLEYTDPKTNSRQKCLYQTNTPADHNSISFMDLDYSMKFIIKVYSVTDYLTDKTGYTIEPFVSPELYTRPQRSNAYVGGVTDTSITITNLTSSGVTSNEIIIKGAGYSNIIETSNKSYTIEGLEPGTYYNITIIPYYYDVPAAVGSDSYLYLHQTTKPGKVKNVRITSEKYTVTGILTRSKLHIHWEKPSGSADGYKIKIYNYGNSTWETNPFETVTIEGKDNTYKLIQANGGIQIFTRYKVEIITTLGSSESEPYTEEIWTSPDPTTLTINTQSNGKVVEFVYSYKNNLAPYNNSNTTKKFYLCYGATEEEVLSGNYCIDIPNDVSTQTSGNTVTCTIGYPFNSDTIKNIINTIGTPDCYFAIQTKLPDSPYNGADFYSNVVSYTLPPLPITPSTTYTYNRLGGLNSSGYWKVNAADVSSEGITLKWTNPQVWDSIKIYVYTSFTEKQLITTITKSNPVEQYIVTAEYFQNAYIYSNRYIFIVQTEYKNLKSEEVELWAQKTW